MVCGNPRDKRVKYWTEFLDARKAKHPRSRLRTPSGVSWPPRSNKTKTALRTTAHPGEDSNHVTIPPPLLRDEGSLEQHRLGAGGGGDSTPDRGG